MNGVPLGKQDDGSRQDNPKGNDDGSIVRHAHKASWPPSYQNDQG
jgi:hypothetical protein